jgi:predicted O-methyltransferase YrrM
MNQDQWTEVDHYFVERLMPPDTVLEAALEANEAAELPSIDVSPLQGKFLHLLALTKSARRILEIGMLGGYSTIWLARALPADGRMITLELDPKHAEVARTNLERAGVSDRVEVRVGPATQSLAQLHAEGAEPFELIFLDADKPSNPEYLQWALKLARRGSLIVVDNVVREGKIVDPASTAPDVQGTRALFDLLATEPRLASTAIQTVGSKGYDGFVMAVVLGE